MVYSRADVLPGRRLWLLSRSVRKPGTVYRYGGEEFALVLPGTDESDIGAVAERIRSRAESPVS
ncbi:diguanylate cyclase [Marinobacterium sp. D7]|uniref:diguanylate cyclase domain-containing protein n=1 Tax=Marinobacterium ramblicola TaxID=2849041 RepID=UPI001C2D7D66|nr:diguanylate cyclase [Marinobacterium ramblicola]